MHGCLESGGLMTGGHIVPNSRYSYLTIDYIHALTQTWDFIIIFLMRGWIVTHVSNALAPYQQIFYLPQMLQKAVKSRACYCWRRARSGLCSNPNKVGECKEKNHSKTPPDWGVVTQHTVNTPMGKRADSQLFKETTKTWGIKAAGRSDEGINFFCANSREGTSFSPVPL